MGSSVIKSLNAGSGIDTTSLVEGLVKAEKGPKETLLTSRQTKLETQISGYGTFKSALSEFQNAMKPLTDADTFKARAVSFPDTDIISPSKLDADAQTGSFQIEVLDVAQSQSLASGLIDDADAALGAGELTFRFGSWDSYTGTGVAGTPAGFSPNGDKEALTITLDADDSLNDLVKKINASDSGLQAAVVKDDGKSKLLLTAPSGANNAVEIDSTGAAALSKFEFNATTSEMEQTQSAQDARLKVNGLEVTRESNEVSDVIQGLTFSINKASAGDKINFSITEDKSTAETAVRDFVEAYNLLYKTMDNLTSNKAATEDDKTLGSLRSDGSAKNMMNQLKSMLTGSVAGSDSDFNALTFAGIRTQKDGTLEINEDDFKKAIEDNFTKIGELFAPNYSATNAGVSVTPGSYVEKATSGTYDINITTEPTKGYLHGNEVTGLTFPVNTGDGGNYSFKISVDGTSSATITLPDQAEYNSVDEIAADLQSRINGDETLKKARAAVDVSYNTDTNKFEFTSREFGTNSKIEFTEASGDMSNWGITTALTGTAGINVAGTINGEEAYGAGNILLPKVDSDPYGLNFTIGSGSLGTSSFTFGRGLAGELSLLIDNFVNSSDGAIKTREDSINKEIEGVKSDKEDLDARMEKVEARLMSQFKAMERILTSLNGTSDSLDGLIDRLPFTAKK